LRESVATLAYLKVHPAVRFSAEEIVFIEEFIRDVRYFDTDIFGIGHGRVKIKVLEINGAKPRAFTRENAVQ